MKFTTVFPSPEGSDLSIAAVFTPCLVWKEGNMELLNPHPQNPHYLPGDLQALFAKVPLQFRMEDYSKQVALIVHPVGHGTAEYRELLLADLRAMGFEPKVLALA